MFAENSEPTLEEGSLLGKSISLLEGVDVPELLIYCKKKKKIYIYIYSLYINLFIYIYQIYKIYIYILCI